MSTIPFGDIFGIIVNYVTIKWFGMWESRHWFPMRPINNNKNINNFNNDNTNDSNNNNVSDNGENNNNNNNNIWYSFDSNLSSPRPFPPDLKEVLLLFIVSFIYFFIFFSLLLFIYLFIYFFYIDDSVFE